MLKFKRVQHFRNVLYVFRKKVIKQVNIYTFYIFFKTHIHTPPNTPAFMERVRNSLFLAVCAHCGPRCY